jgi:peptidoglycan/xylan/chitin deacetylase (PgdA/CDA1 family)
VSQQYSAGHGAHHDLATMGALDGARMTAGARTLVPVLLYHSVSDLPAAGQEAFTVTPRRFADHVAAIVDSGRVALTVSELAAAIRGERDLPERAVAVTFDDGFDDTPAATELLRANGLVGTVYVTAGRVGRSDGMSAAALDELRASGAEIGAHTVSHPYLDELARSAAAREIAESKSQLEQHLGSPVRTFAYPHGAYDGGVRFAVVAAGFTSGAAVKNALSHSADDPFAIARWTVMGETSTDTVCETLAGRGLPVAWRNERLRTRVFREYRRIRRRTRALRGSASIGGDRHAA